MALVLSLVDQTVFAVVTDQYPGGQISIQIADSVAKSAPILSSSNCSYYMDFVSVLYRLGQFIWISAFHINVNIYNVI